MERPREFWTADGFVLMYDPDTNDWSDGELVFAARESDLWPLDSDNEPLEGSFINESR